MPSLCPLPVLYSEEYTVRDGSSTFSLVTKLYCGRSLRWFLLYRLSITCSPFSVLFNTHVNTHNRRDPFTISGKRVNHLNNKNKTDLKRE